MAKRINTIYCGLMQPRGKGTTYKQINAIITGLILPLLFSTQLLHAQTIKGAVTDKENKRPIAEVNIENIYTSTTIHTDEQGLFTIGATNGQLLLFRKDGYKPVHVRVPLGTIPPYFKITMEHLYSPQIYEVHDWKYDSTKEYEEYKHELDFPKMNTWDMIQHPFWAMDQRNREIWAFQDQYKMTEEEKYVDYLFNKQTITKLTGLQGDSLAAYMKRYRPSYEQARSMSEYNFYGYIRKTVLQYRKSGHSSSRLTN